MNTVPEYFFKEISSKSEIIISLEKGYLKVLNIGEKNHDNSYNLWKNIVESCEECDCYKVLGISLTTESNLDSVQAYDYIDIFQKLDIDHRYKIAWIENNPEFKEMIKFIETIFYNRNLPGKVFDKEDEALEWLIGKKQSWN